uniref:ATP synthase complex subunit 8 n=1 Tax=Trachys variolaris TaxID=2823040 RepID=A0A8A6W5R0_9COLE|nr:ATP synthase F0 subunit 8 [Trachys variolaris]QTK22439.1 ATP synthase F0 subunit 8 [Trachys variolaris]
MPQMAPLSWLMLFITFSLTLIIFTIINYYSTRYQPSKPSMMNKQMNIVNWKW